MNKNQKKWLVISIVIIIVLALGLGLGLGLGLKKQDTHDYFNENITLGQNKKLKIASYDFWSGFNINDFYFVKILRKYFDIEIVDCKNSSDILFFSIFGTLDKNIKAKRKIFYTGENRRFRDFINDSDAAFTFDYDNHPKNFRFPLWIFHAENVSGGGHTQSVSNPIKFFSNHPNNKKTDFCSFVASNNVDFRNNFVKKLSKYKKVNCGGKSLNNIGGKVKDKREYQKKHKFTVCFENSSYPGYCTEKILDGFMSQTIPIYWGDPYVTRDFNPETFINYFDFKTEEDLIEYIKKVDNDEELYLSYFNKPILSTYWQDKFKNPDKFEKEIAEFIIGKKF